MKTLCCYITLLLLTAPAPCRAQCPSDKGQIEIAVSHGLITGNEISDKLASTNTGKKQTFSSGADFITLRYFFYNRLAVGFTGGITSERGHYSDIYDPSFITSTYTRSITTFAPEFYYIYFFRKYIEVYMLFGIGPSFSTTNTTLPSTAYGFGTTSTASSDAIRIQCTPIGIRVGGRIGAFLEVGMGYKGIINAGASFKFGPSCWWKG
jgi:hypothetical protein